MKSLGELRGLVRVFRGFSLIHFYRILGGQNPIGSGLVLDPLGRLANLLGKQRGSKGVKGKWIRLRGLEGLNRDFKGLKSLNKSFKGPGIRIHCLIHFYWIRQIRKAVNVLKCLNPIHSTPYKGWMWIRDLRHQPLIKGFMVKGDER